MIEIIAPCGKRQTVGDSCYKNIDFTSSREQPDKKLEACSGCQIRRKFFSVDDPHFEITRTGSCFAPSAVPSSK